MGKILSFGYLDDWRKDHEQWEDKQQKAAEPQAPNAKASDKMQSEYQESMSANRTLNKYKQPLKPIS